MNLTYKQAALLLSRLPKIGPRTAKKLIDHFPDLARLFTLPSAKLLRINGLGKSHLQAIRSWETQMPQLLKRRKRDHKTRFKGASLWRVYLSFTPFVYG